MPVTNIDKDPEALTFTVSAEFDATADRAWQLWADPRQLERWWGPPDYPATVVDHDLTAGGRVTYFMTGPEGEVYRAWWQVLAVDPPNRLELVDGFADEHGEVDESLPTTTMVATITERGDGSTLMVLESRFETLEGMEQLVAMGMEEGISSALAQIDALLAEGASEQFR